MVELICVVAAHVYIEQGIDMLNVFKVNYNSYRATCSGSFIKFKHACQIDLV